jgi:tetratricopeptide (TPR) repeat protein
VSMPTFQTLAHEVLALEALVKPVAPATFRYLDTILSHAQATVSWSGANDEGNARSVLGQIEALLTSHRFLCKIPWARVERLDDALQPDTIVIDFLAATENEKRREVLRDSANQQVWEYAHAHDEKEFHYSDCDLTACLYIAIAELLQLPIAMCEIPFHNFVRWRLPDGLYLNWDTNFGYDRWTDAEYRAQKDVPADSSAFLVTLSREETIGYFNFVQGLGFARDGRWPEAIRSYRTALTLVPRVPSARVNIAWAYVTEPALRSTDHTREALTLAQQAVAIFKNSNTVETLAYALAENGRFEQAASSLLEAVALDSYEAVRDQRATRVNSRMADVFRDGKTYLEDLQNNEETH